MGRAVGPHAAHAVAMMAVEASLTSSYSEHLEDGSLYGRRTEWNDRSQLSEEGPPPWQSHTREDLLNVYLEQHPHWVAKAPGTHDSTKERYNILEPRLDAPVAAAPWDARAIVAHCLDGNPTVNGMRKLSPARRRHNGGVGAD